MCEPLIEKEQRVYKTFWFYSDDVKSAVKFYQKYRYHKAMLRDNEKNAWEDWIKSDYFKMYKMYEINNEYLLMYDVYKDWLFNYSFRDVIK